MDNELCRSIFDSACDRFSSTGRWTTLTVLILLVFHIVIFHPFVRTSRDLHISRTEAQALQALKPKLQDLHEMLHDLSNTSKSQIDGAIKDLLNNKIKDFQALNRQVQDIRGEGLREPSVSPTIQTAPGVSSPALSDLPPLDSELIKRIRQAPPDEILPLLRDFINSHIIERRFLQTNQILQQRIAPAIIQQVEGIRAQVNKLATESPQWENRWGTLRAALSQTEETAHSLTLTPPAGDDWWFSVTAKIQALDKLGEEIVASLDVQQLESVGDNLKGTLDKALDQQTALESTLLKQIDDLTQQFKALQEQVQILGQPFKWLALDLASAAARFPLSLALVLAVLSLSISHRVRELSLALDLLPEPKQALWTWYFQHTSGILATWFPTTVSKTQSKILFQGLPELLASLAWVTLATWQVTGWHEVASSASAGMLLIGALALLAAYGYRQRIIREAMRLSGAA